MAKYMFVFMVIHGLQAAADYVKCWNKPCMCCANGACTTQGDTLFTCNGCISGFTGHNCYEPCQENCVNCSQTFFINDRICYTCKNGYYNGRPEDIAYFPVQNDCSLSCQPACESCISYYKCTKCKTGYYMSDSKDCYPCADNCAYCLSPTYCQQCKTGFFLDTSGNTCKPCKPYCKTCRSYQTCTECDDGFFLDDNNCRLCEDACIVCTGLNKCNECQKGHYLNNGRCSKCSVNCYDCYLTFGSNNTCTLCQNGFYLFDGSCNKCDIGCAQCKSENNCLKCLSDFKMYDGKCYKCRTPCAICSSDDVCITCQSGYFVHTGQCHLCPEKCIACSSHEQNQICTGGFYGHNCSIRCPHNCTYNQTNCTTIAYKQHTHSDDGTPLAGKVVVAVGVILIVAVLTIICLIYMYLTRNRAAIRIKSFNDHTSPSGIVRCQCMFGLCSIVIEDVVTTASHPQEHAQELIQCIQAYDPELNKSQTLEKDDESDSDDGQFVDCPEIYEQRDLPTENNMRNQPRASKQQIYVLNHYSS